MIKELQKKFIITAMAAITVLLLVLLGAINGVNYVIVGRQTDKTLVMLAENEGASPPQPEPKAAGTPEDAGERAEKKDRPEFLTPPGEEDIAMSSRYFLVRLNPEGTITQTDVSRISSVTEEEAEALALEASGKADTGSIGRFKYKSVPSREGRGTAIVFLDTSSQLYSILIVLVLSAGMGLICWLLMLFLVVLLSKRAIRPIAENMELQKQFVTNAGHEIKTPLAVILANTDALELHNGESKWSRNIRSQTLRLSGLMQKLLLLARMDEGKMELAFTDFSMSSLVEETIRTFGEAAELKQIAVRQEIQQGVTLRGSRDSIGQLCSILMDNAVKYADQGGEIRVSLRKREKAVVLKVENTCAEPLEGEPDRLFDRFYRGDSARTQKNGGYGIGLSVARAVAEAHHGTISAVFEEEHRIVFTVRL